MATAHSSKATWWRAHRLARWTVLLPLLTTCCSFTPRYTPPQTVLPAAFPGADAADSRRAPILAADLGWRSFFSDPELQSLIARALANNADMRIASARIGQAQAAMRARGGDLAPQVSGSLGMTKLSPPDQIASLLGKDTLTSYDGLLQASWELDFFGRLRSLRAAALEQYLASEQARRAVAIDLIARVATAYLTDRDYDERLNLARQTLANRLDSVHMFTRRYQVGSGSNLDVTQAETLRTQAAAAVEALELARAQNLDGLGVLVGEPIAASSFRRGLSEVAGEQSIPAGLPSDLLVNRPDILAAEHRLRAADADIGAARAAFLPSITLTGAAGTSSDALGSLFEAGTGLWLFRPAMSLPIFSGGKLRANLQGARAQREEAVATYQKAVQSAFRDVADALAQRRWVAAQVETAQQAVAAHSERRRLAQLRYDAGRSPYLEVLDAERDLFAAREQLIELRRALLASGVALYAAIGGTVPQAAAQTGETRP
jgi:NodT family efflux transporter outer membrane factor (OMF) lipoprotein